MSDNKDNSLSPLIYGVRYNGERAMLITPYRDRKMQELCVLHAAAEKQTESEVGK